MQIASGDSVSVQALKSKFWVHVYNGLFSTLLKWFGINFSPAAAGWDCWLKNMNHQINWREVLRSVWGCNDVCV